MYLERHLRNKKLLKQPEEIPSKLARVLLSYLLDLICSFMALRYKPHHTLSCISSILSPSIPFQQCLLFTCRPSRFLANLCYVITPMFLTKWFHCLRLQFYQHLWSITCASPRGSLIVLFAADIYEVHHQLPRVLTLQSSAQITKHFFL